MEKIVIYTDGAARGNPGKGGYGVVLMAGKHRKELSEAFRRTTNNRMELLAVVRALQALKRNDLPIEIHTDSRYVCDAINKGWLMGWQRKGFQGKKNVDLWKMLIPYLVQFKPKFFWVKGHNGHPLNERCDELATLAADNGPFKIDSTFEAEEKASKDNSGLFE
ncbi:MAG: ribonuclease HI [Bacteroidota bacterium]|nr:ribonuclease HI [Bacteroidota bacterium]MDX5431743.1 ribonuclease HI [Bacteroidota bacterium]MDX5470458.1 ribonuclease HI [Bacteroidota bacterium]